MPINRVLLSAASRRVEKGNCSCLTLQLIRHAQARLGPMDPCRSAEAWLPGSSPLLELPSNRALVYGASIRNAADPARPISRDFSQ
jgi:hypothetical protein